MAADGKMRVTGATYGMGVEILNRPPYEGVPTTLDFTSVSDTADNGEKVVKAGTPITDKGVASTGGTDAVGILLFDVYESRPQGTLLKKAYINLTRVKESLGEEKYGTQYTDDILSALKTALPMVVFEEKPAGE